MDHFISEFCDNLKDELEDILEDNKLYEELKAAGMHSEAKTMEEIANDEYYHAKAYRAMLEKHGHPMSEEAIMAEKRQAAHWDTFGIGKEGYYKYGKELEEE